jgi:carboxypeptidase family protein/TonB-dependent receptor-like protein
MLAAVSMLGTGIVPAAEAQDVAGAVEARVVDFVGVPVPDVVVVAIGPHRRQLATATSNERGYFRLVALPVGTYTIVLRRVGYRPVSVERVTVRLGATTGLGMVRLEVGAVELPPVIVIGEQPVIDPTTSAIGGNLHSDLFEALPVERNFHALPGLLPQANLSYFGDEINIAGSSGPENVYYIDGVNVTDPYRASTSGDLPYNFIKEIEVKTGGYQAEYGRALGGIVNVITHSGGNNFRGEGFGFFTNSGLSGNWRRGLADANLDASGEHDAGLSLSGPLVRDRLWFFTAYSRAVRTQDLRIPGFAAQRDSRTSHLFAAKFDWQPVERTTVALTILGDPSTRQLVSPAFTAYGSPTGLDNIDPFLGELQQGGVAVSVRASHRVGGRFLLESVLSRLAREEIRRGGTERARREPLVMDLETGRWSGGFGDDSEHHSARSAAKVSGLLSLGAHALKAGVEYEDNRLDAQTHFSDPGIAVRLNDTTYQAVYLIASGTVHNRIASVFLQDSWLLAPRLRLNAGLRWDGQHLVGADGRVAQTITGLQPRIGLIVQPAGPGSKIFASYGRFYEQLPLFASGTWWHVPVRNGVYFFDRDPRAGAAPRDSLDTGSHGILPEVPGLRGQHFDEVTAGYERALWTRVKVGVRGIYRSLREVIDDGLAPTTVERIIGNPGRGELAFLPRLRREYYALEFTLEWRDGKALDLGASYTLSRNHGNYTGLYDHDVDYETPNGKTNPDLAEQVPNSSGLLPNDRPHVFKFFGSHRLDFGLTVGTFFSWQSGTPLSEFGATFLPAHFAFLGPRGTVGRTPSIRDLNLRLTYDVPGGFGSSVRPRVILDLLHLASARRAVTVDQHHYSALDGQGNQTAPNPNYLKPTRHQPPMSVRLGGVIGF